MGLYFHLFLFHFSNYSVLKIFIDKYFEHIHCPLETCTITKDECQQSVFPLWATDEVYFHACFFFRQNYNKFILLSITCSIVKYLCAMFCLPDFYTKILYDWCNVLNNLWFFNSIKTHSIYTYINYTNLWRIHETTSFSGHSTDN